MPVRLTILCDNAAAPGLGAEWGLSVAVQPGDGTLWLWDAGQSGLFLDNARALGVNPELATGLALSHGHYDHTGGMAALLEAGFTGPIVAHPEAATLRYHHGKSLRQIGPPAPLPEFEPVEDNLELAPGLTMFTNIARRPGLFEAVRGFSLDTQGNCPDNVPDDAFLLLETPRGPVVLLGCCHSGLENSLLHLRERRGIEHFHAVVGGLHLFAEDETQWTATADVVRRFGVRLLAAGHCTGADALAFLQRKLDCEVRETRSGTVLDFD